MTTNRLQCGAAWLESQRHNFLTSTVTYRRGDESLSVQATIGRTEFDLADESGILQRVESRDFLITVAELEYGLPRAGDRIVEGERVYEVMPFGDSPAWRYSDQYGLTLRIHTKAIGKANAA